MTSSPDLPVPTPPPGLPRVSIVIPVRNEERFMAACLRSLRELDYPADQLELIFADGRSTDRTAELARAGGSVVVDNPGLKISAGRNAGFAASHGELVAFTDADCLFPRDWVRRAAAHFADPAVAGVGGPTPIPPDQDDFGWAVNVVFRMAGLAGGTVHFAALNGTRPAEDLPGCNAFYRRVALATIMPTDTRLFSNEDVQMNAALRARGFQLRLAPDVWVYHYKRSSPVRFWKQMYVFAIGRLQLGKSDRRFLKPSHWLLGAGLPAALLAGGLATLAWPGFLSAAATVAGLIALGLFLYYGITQSARRAAYVLLALALFLTAWPLGFLRELCFPIPLGYTSAQKPV